MKQALLLLTFALSFHWGVAQNQRTLNQSGTTSPVQPTTIELFAAIPTVAGFATFNNSAVSFVIVKDTVQGGTFGLYNGTEIADGGMVFADQLGRKWMRQVADNRIMFRWYGLVPYPNYGFSDDAIVIRKALRFIERNNKYNTLVFDACPANSWWYIKSSIFLSNVSIEGVGQERNPSSRFQVAPFVTAFRILGTAQPVNVKNIQIGHYAPPTPDSNSHSFDIHAHVNFENVYVTQNRGGNGFNINACPFGPKTDSARYGNSDHSQFKGCQAQHCLNGFWINGCDANLLSFTDCSAVANHRWGFYDMGFLGNRYYNTHASDNGKEANTGASLTVGNNTVTYFLKADFGPVTIGKRPDLYPQYWYMSNTNMGRIEPWNSKRQYWTGGPFFSGDVNSNHAYIATYTEGHQPASIISPRSVWIEGTNGAPVIGGMYEHTYNGTKYFTGLGLHSEGLLTAPNLLLNNVLAPRGGNGEYVSVTIKPDLATNHRTLQLPDESGTLATNNVVYLNRDPVAGDLPSNNWKVFRNTVTGLTYMAANINGKIVKTLLQ